MTFSIGRIDRQGGFQAAGRGARCGRLWLAMAAIAVCGAFTSAEDSAAADAINFNRDIRPILSDKCFACHGADAANQDSPLRLDSYEHAIEDLGGYAGIVPGDLEASEVYARVTSEDADIMPPPESNRSLTAQEKQLLADWIKSGGEYEKHWSFTLPARPELPGLSEKSAAWARNPIDHFIAARLEKEGLSPTQEASTELLMRRAALTLTGLPPKPRELDAALKGGAANAYEQFVDQLLGSMDYAERQTLTWLDAARYADTDGYQNDFERKNWPWRDWVIKAFRDNMPFDRFTVEQLAGDMLPDADEESRLASAFNRNHRQNAEGGALAAEFAVENVIDRVETTSTVWLGLTMGCARCHDHKFDPLSQREFFQLYGYFNNIGEKGIGKGIEANPTMNIRSPLVEIPVKLRAELEAAENKRDEALATLQVRALTWADSARSGQDGNGEWSAAVVPSAEASNGVELEQLPDGTWLAGGKETTNTDYTLQVEASGRITALAITALAHERLSKPRRLAPSSNGNFVLSELEVNVVDAAGGTSPLPIALAKASYEQGGYPATNAIDGRSETGWAVFGPNPETLPPVVALYLQFEQPVELPAGARLETTLRHQSQYADHHIGRFRVLLSSADVPSMNFPEMIPAEVAAAVAAEPAARSEQDIKRIVEHFKTIDPDLRQADSKLADVQNRVDAVGGAKQPVMVMRERDGERVPAYLLERGQYDSPDKSEELPREIPAALASEEVANDPPKDRLELANWIVSRDNPLTARVVVNRIWRDHFGIGLVKTVEDFGSQGEYPSHPELLDWLAVEFIDSGWDLQALHRLILTSATYRQSSRATPELLARDPENRLLARGPRYRRDGFSIRDGALQAAGLLDERVGGPPVKPYQPAGLWATLAANRGTDYDTSSGADLYRKSLYTYWKRAVNPPRQLIFDAGGREACNVYVRRTNTPLQALALMNDVTFIEAARHVAQQALEPDESATERLSGMYRRVTARQPSPQTLEVLATNLAFFQQHYSDHPDEAKKLLSQGASPHDESLPVVEHAAWTAVAHLLLNLDETISVE